MSKRTTGNRSAARLILFSRYPEPGRVKTRLIPVLGADQAAALQREMTAGAVRTAQSARARTAARIEIRYDGRTPAQWRRWVGKGISFRPQGEGDLGQRLERGFSDAFASGDRRVVIIGCDSPALDAELLVQAFAALDTADVVIGPARDGGYYLIGLRLAAPGLFRGIAWGSAQVQQQTLEAAGQLGLRHTLLPLLDDVDRPGDLAVWKRESERGATLAVVIPALNEEGVLEATLTRVLESQPQEVIVVDGGSGDRTAEVARAMGVEVVIAPRGRGHQMNMGAKAASAAHLLFLHADTLPPSGYREVVRRILQHADTAAGAFRFAIHEPIRHRWLVERLVATRCGLLRTPFGDQGLFVRRDLFWAIGGFSDWPILEDVEILHRLKPHGRLAIAPAAVATSGRRWQARGVWSTMGLNTWILLGYRLGVPLERLARKYAGS